MQRKRSHSRTTAAIAVGSLVLIACADREPAPVCPVPTEISNNEKMVVGYDQLDMMVVVDNSASMGEEQRILSTSFFNLVNALVNPTPDWEYPPVDDVRISIVSSDLGLSYGGRPLDLDPGLLAQFQCTAAGDDGAFQSYGAGKAIEIGEGVIRCAPGQGQCPAGWECADLGDQGIGRCVDPDGDGTNQICPGLGATWAETTPAEPNSELAFQVACLANLGTDGCGFEQQLQAGARGFERNPEFIREEALTAVLVVSDEEDCSIEDPALFQVPEITDLTPPHELNLACGRNEDLLFATEHLREAFIEAKRGREESVIFSAIVGVPPAPECQGKGDELGECLDRPEMKKTEILEDDVWVYAPACQRFDGDQLVTKARPGRRYVDLAGQFGQRSYVTSICNPSWGPAMAEIAALIAEQFAGTCYPKPLEWDPESERAKCDMVIEFIDLDECPFPLEAGAAPVAETYSDEEDVEHTRLLCPLPRLSAPLDCAAAEALHPDAGDEFGWYYCEDQRENFEDACNPAGAWAGNDEDRDGLIDCADPDCMECKVCDPDGPGCERSCKFAVQLTRRARDAARGRQVAVQCLQQFSFEDPNCQEDGRASCNDDADNDGNGVWDCEDVTEGDRPHRSDPGCCPMTVDADNNCVIDERTFDNCDSPQETQLPDACLAAQRLYGCVLPTS